MERALVIKLTKDILRSFNDILYNVNSQALLIFQDIFPSILSSYERQSNMSMGASQQNQNIKL